MIPSFNLANLNALRSLLFPGQFGGNPPMSGMPVQGTAMAPNLPATTPQFLGTPVRSPGQFPIAQPPVGGPLPAQPSQFQNLMALRSLAPQSQMRMPMMRQY